MNEQERREECLRLAHLHGEPSEMTIKRAEAYLLFIQNGTAKASADAPVAGEKFPERSH